MPAPEMTPELIDGRKTDVIIGALLAIAAGPREAYAILIAVLYNINFTFSENPVPVNQLCEELTISLRSITEARPQ